MQNKLRILLLLVLMNQSSFSFAQNTPINFNLKDTTSLNGIIDLQLAQVHQKKDINYDTLVVILQNALWLKDTTTFFKFSSKIIRHYYKEKGYNEEAIFFLKKCQKLIGTNSHPEGNFDNDLGGMHNRMGMSIEAIDYFFRSVEWHKKYDEQKTTIPLGNVAMVYFENEDYEKALKYNLEALDYSLLLEEPKHKLYNLIYDYYRLGKVFSKLDKDTKAERFFNLSLEAAKEKRDSNMIILAICQSLPFFHKIGKDTYCQNLIDQAEECLQGETDISRYLIELLAIEKNNFYLETNQFKKALDPKEIETNRKFLKNKYHLYAVAYYAEKNDTENIIKSYESILEESKRMQKESNKNSFSYLEQKYQNKELTKTNKILTDEIASRKRTILLILGSLFLISSLFVLQLFNNRRHKKLNSLLQNKTTEAENINKHLSKSNEELERFAYIASHDLKTPLRDIVSFTSLLERELKHHENENVHQYLSFIKDGGIRMNNLIISTLEYSRLSHSEKQNEAQNIDLKALVEEVQKSLSKHIDESKANITIQGNLPHIKAHRASMVLLFQNLLENGIKYNTSPTPLVKLYAKDNPEFVSVFIEDNGIGIPEQYHNKIFVMFSRLHNHNEYKGSGLGLSICKKVVESLEGEIILTSSKENGSIFEIRFPNNTILQSKYSAKALVNNSN